MSAKKRVVVTGMGALTPLANDVSMTWEAILNSQSGIGPITRFDASNMSVKIAGELKNFDPTLVLSKKELRRNDNFIIYALEAARQAVLDAGLSDYSDKNRVGVAVGAGIGGLPCIETNHFLSEAGGVRKISPFFITGSIINMSAGMVAIQHGLRGPNVSMVSACATGAHNIGYAYRTIQYGDADVMVAGGSEMTTTQLGLGGFAQCRALSIRNENPQAASRPWDRDRDGFVLSEGAGILVLESLDSALKRGVPIHAEVMGFGMSDDAYHITSPDPSGVGFVRCMQNAIADAGLVPADIDYINAHGTSTPMADPIELKAIKTVFTGEHDRIKVSSTKSMTGHMLGATGAVEALFCILAMRDQVAPPTINCDHPDEGCDLNLVQHTAQETKIQATLSNSFGFGGTNTSLVFKQYQG